MYSVKLVDDEPFPEIVPPVESTHTSGKRLISARSWPAHGAIDEIAAPSNSKTTGPTRRARTPEDLTRLPSLRQTTLRGPGVLGCGRLCVGGSWMTISGIVTLPIGSRATRTTPNRASADH